MTDQTKSLLRREISVGELIGVVIMILGLCITFYSSVNVSLENHELRVKTLESERTDYRVDKTELRVEAKEAQRQNEIRYDKIEAKMDQVITALNELKVDIQKKEDKK